MVPELERPAIFPPISPVARLPRPSTGSLQARFPSFPGTLSSSDSLPLVPSARCLCLRYHPRRLSSLRWAGQRSHPIGLGLVLPATPPRHYWWKRQGLPGSWRTPLSACPALRLRSALTARPFSGSVLPSVNGTTSAPTITDFGVQSHGRHLRSPPLHSPGYPSTVGSSLPAGGHPSPGGTLTRWVRSEGFRI